jgi:hypothetical protein
MSDLSKALFALYPTAKWTLNGDSYEGLTWLSNDIQKPTEQELLEWVDPNAYKYQRAREYPPVTDYLDGVVKGNQAQIDKYIADCLAVKAKYPKPE